MFMLGEFDEFAIGIGIKVLNSSPYYTQANAKSKLLIKGLLSSLSERLKKTLNGGILC